MKFRAEVPVSSLKSIRDQTYRVFSRARYTQFRAKYPRQRESQSVQRVVKEWQAMTHEEIMRYYTIHVKDNELNTFGFSQSEDEDEDVGSGKGIQPLAESESVKGIQPLAQQSIIVAQSKPISKKVPEPKVRVFIQNTKKVQQDMRIFDKNVDQDYVDRPFGGFKKYNAEISDSSSEDYQTLPKNWKKLIRIRKEENMRRPKFQSFIELNIAKRRYGWSAIQKKNVIEKLWQIYTKKNQKKVKKTKKVEQVELQEPVWNNVDLPDGWTIYKDIAERWGGQEKAHFEKKFFDLIQSFQWDSQTNRQVVAHLWNCLLAKRIQVKNQQILEQRRTKTKYFLTGQQYFNLKNSSVGVFYKDSRRMWDRLPTESKEHYKSLAEKAGNPQNQLQYERLLTMRKLSGIEGRKVFLRTAPRSVKKVVRRAALIRNRVSNLSFMNKREREQENPFNFMHSTGSQ